MKKPPQLLTDGAWLSYISESAASRDTFCSSSPVPALEAPVLALEQELELVRVQEYSKYPVILFQFQN